MRVIPFLLFLFILLLILIIVICYNLELVRYVKLKEIHHHDLPKKYKHRYTV